MRHLKAALIFIGVIILAYLSASFIAWDYNAWNWDNVYRAFSLLFGVLFASASVSGYYEATKSNT